MTTATWILLGIAISSVALLVIGCDRLERRYRRMHPPDGWDGMREDDWDDEDPGE